MTYNNELLQALGIDERRAGAGAGPGGQEVEGERVAVIGSGGKTSLLKGLGAESGLDVLLSTTVHMAAPQHEDYPGEFCLYTDAQAVQSCWQGLLVQRRREGRLQGICLLTARQGLEAGGKCRLTGLTAREMDELGDLIRPHLLVVEADGSRRLPIKAHAPFEPVLFPSCTLGVAVIGLRSLWQPVDEFHVHRPELVTKLLGCREGHVLDQSDMARVAAEYLLQFNTSRRTLVFSQFPAARWSWADRRDFRNMAEICLDELQRLAQERGIKTAFTLSVAVQGKALNEGGWGLEAVGRYEAVLG